jgi:hypothetical protein
MDQKKVLKWMTTKFKWAADEIEKHESELRKKADTNYMHFMEEQMRLLPKEREVQELSARFKQYLPLIEYAETQNKNEN